MFAFICSLAAVDVLFIVLVLYAKWIPGFVLRGIYVGHVWSARVGSGWRDCYASEKYAGRVCGRLLR